MPNSNVNHVVINGVTKLDLRSDTVSPSSLAQGYTAHDASGAQITGTMTGGSMVIRDEEDSNGGTIRHITAGDVVQGTKTITENGTHDVAAYADAYVNVQTTPNLQAKTNIAPTTSSQTVRADSGYDGLSSVQINAMPSGTAGTPTATKGTVSNHSVSVTPSVTNTTGYISGGTKTGTAVSVSASELVSGTLTISSSGTKDVTNYASASVAAGGATASATKGTVSNNSVSITPSVTKTAGYITAGTSSGTAVTVTAAELVSGNKAITENGTSIDVTSYATVSVNVQGGADIPTFTAIWDDSLGDYSSITCDWTYAECVADAESGTMTAALFVETDAEQSYSTALGMSCQMAGSKLKYYAGVGLAFFQINYTASGITWSYSPDVYQSLTATQNGTYTPTSGKAYNSVTVDVPTGGGTGGDMSDPIRFFDYDGTLVASYSSVPSSLPSIPSHTGLTNGTWNYTLAQITTQFNAMGTCDVGANYDTVSGATEIDIILQQGRLHPYLSLAVNGTVEIDWGDGSTSTSTGTSTASRKSDIHHEYAAAGSYTIKITKTSGVGYSLYSTSTYSLLHKGVSTSNANRVYSSRVQNVRIGSDCSIGNSAFYNCYSLASISLPSSVTSIAGSAFYNCYSLEFVALPFGMTSVGGSAFSTCNSLKTVSIPASVTSIASSMFSSCNSLTSVIIPSGVTIIASNAFSYCYSLESVIIPSGVTSIGASAFTSCSSLKSIAISSGVTNISSSTLNNCYSLTSVTIPSGVTNIDAQAFSGCYGMAEYHFEPTTPPTLANISAFTSIQSDCVIYVPSASLTAYQEAENWSTYASYMVGE